MTFILAMVLFPEVQSKAQAEIDTVCASRLPTFDDFEDLPYVQAIVNEALRWNPVVPECRWQSLLECSTLNTTFIAASHAATEDDIYEGYFIPKGSIASPITWSFAHDPSVYRDPSEFRPERYLGPSP